MSDDGLDLATTRSYTPSDRAPALDPYARRSSADQATRPRKHVALDARAVSSATGSHSDTDTKPARRVKSCGAESNNHGSFDATTSRSSQGSGASKGRKSSIASSASSLVRNIRHVAAPRGSSADVSNMPFLKKATKRVNSFGMGNKAEKRSSEDGQHGERRESSKRKESNPKEKECRQFSHGTRSSYSSGAAAMSDRDEPHNIEVSAEEARDIIAAHREGLDAAEKNRQAGNDIPGPKETEWLHTEPAAEPSSPQQPQCRQTFRLDFSRLTPQIRYPAGNAAPMLQEPGTLSPGTLPYNIPMKPDLAPISELDPTGGPHRRSKGRSEGDQSSDQGTVKDGRRRKRPGSRDSTHTAHSLNRVPTVRFGSQSTEHSSGRTSTTRSSQADISSIIDRKAAANLRKQSAPVPSERRKSFRHWLFRTTGRSQSEPTDKAIQAYIAQGMLPTVDTYVYPLVNERSVNKVSSITGMSRTEVRDFGEERKKPLLGKRRISVKLPSLKFGNEDADSFETRPSLSPGLRPAGLRPSSPAIPHQIDERDEYFQTRRMTGSPLEPPAASTNPQGSQRPSPSRPTGRSSNRRLSSTGTVDRAPSSIDTPSMDFRPSALDFDPPEKTRVEAPAAVHANLVKKPKITSYYFDYRAPVGGGSGLWNSDDLLMSQESLPTVPEPIISSSPAAPIGRPWFRVRLDDEEDASGHAADLGVDESLRYSAWDVPEHLPGSPLCPMSPKHKSGGRGICPVHGRRRTREGRPGSRSEAPGVAVSF